jgi:hypothetical protein
VTSPVALGDRCLDWLISNVKKPRKLHCNFIEKY